MPHAPTLTRPRTLALAVTCTALAALLGCGSDAIVDPASAADGQGTLRVQLTDAPFPYDSVRSVDVFVVRIDAKVEDSDSAAAATNTKDDDKGKDGWVTIAEPKARYDLLTLRDGKTADLGQKALPAGTYRAFRLILDPAQSSVTLKNGTVLTHTSDPGIKFPSADRSGIKIQLDRSVTVGKDATKAVVIDFDVAESFVMRGPAMKNGLLFKPTLRGTSK